MVRSSSASGGKEEQRRGGGASPTALKPGVSPERNACDSRSVQENLWLLEVETELGDLVLTRISIQNHKPGFSLVQNLI